MHACNAHKTRVAYCETEFRLAVGEREDGTAKLTRIGAVFGRFCISSWKVPGFFLVFYRIFLYDFYFWFLMFAFLFLFLFFQIQIDFLIHFAIFGWYIFFITRTFLTLCSHLKNMNILFRKMRIFYYFH